MKNRKKLILGIAILLLWGTAGLTGCGKDGEAILLETEEMTQVSENSKVQETTVATVSGSCFVYVCGQVNAPGVYELPIGSRICDAMEAAGGMTADAGSSYWNLAELLWDGEKIYVPTEAEAQVLGQPPESEQETDAQGITKDGRIDVNTASKEQLMTIPGIGESKADSILAYRKENGNFASPEDIMNITGIKEGLYSKIKDYISTGN